MTRSLRSLVAIASFAPVILTAQQTLAGGGAANRPLTGATIFVVAAGRILHLRPWQSAGGLRCGLVDRTVLRNAKGFASSAKNLGAAGGNIFMHNNATGETRPVTTMTNNSPSGVSIARTGAYIAFGSNNQYDPAARASALFVTFTG